jgi:hypothetical protein
VSSLRALALAVTGLLPAAYAQAPAPTARAPAPTAPALTGGTTAAEAKPPARSPSRRRVVKPPSEPRPGLADSVWLRDGTQLRGTLLRVEPGNYVLLLGIEGVRTIPWRLIERLDNANAAQAGAGRLDPGVALLAPCCADELADADARPAEAAWASVSLGWDLRLEGVALFKRYTVAGREVWYGGEGYGGGASLSLHFRGPTWFGAGATRWTEFELGAGNSLHSVSWKQGAENQTRLLENQTSLILGAHFARGRWGTDGAPPWSGIVLGVAWVPTYVRFFGSSEFDATGSFHPAGVRVTLDWGRLSPGRKGRVPGVRAFLTWLPYIGQLPTSVSFGLGAVFF